MALIFLIPATALAAVCSVGAARLAGAPGIVVACAVALGTMAAWRPATALLVLAGTAPLGGAIAALSGMRATTADLFVLTVISGWLARRAVWREPWDAGAAGSAGFLATLTLASLLVQCLATFTVAAPEGLGALEAVYQWLTGISRVESHPVKPGVIAAVRLMAGLGLFVLAAEVCRRESTSRVALMLTAGSTAVAALNVNRFFELVLRQGGPLVDAAIELHRTVRVSATIPDLNAAGALCALTLPVALSFAFEARRIERLVGLSCSMLLAAGLWLSGSRAAMVAGAIAVVVVAGTSMLRRWKRRRVLALVGVLATVLVGVAVWYPRGAAHTPQSSAWLIRKELAVVALKLTEDDPTFGAGIGQFFDRSAALVSPALRVHYNAENAHNQFLQVLGELGVTGLAAFVLVLATGLGPAMVRLREGRLDPLPTAVTSGTLAFLASALLMHPLLVAESSAAFWLALGVCRGWGREGQPAHETRRLALTTALAIAAVLATVPGRAMAVRRTADLDGVGVGLSRWQVDHAAGRRYRESTGRGVIYIAASARRVSMPVRARGGTGRPSLTLRLDGREAGRFGLGADAWTVVTVNLPPSKDDARFRRLELRLEDAGALLDVGREEIQ